MGSQQEGDSSMKLVSIKSFDLSVSESEKEMDRKDEEACVGEDVTVEVVDCKEVFRNSEIDSDKHTKKNYEDICGPHDDEEEVDGNMKKDESIDLEKGLENKQNKDKWYALNASSVIGTGIESMKYLYSIALLIFCVILVMGLIFTKQTAATSTAHAKDGAAIHPVVAFFIFWFLIFWLAMMEGGQGCLVGLHPVDNQAYAESHPRTARITAIAHKGDNLERFIVGRQFLVVLVVFVINMMASSVPSPEIFGLPDLVKSVFCQAGIALILVTIMLGQLTAQVNAATCMLDFINNYFMLFTTYISLGIEMSGLLHAVYLIQFIFSKFAVKKETSTEETTNSHESSTTKTKESLSTKNTISTVIQNSLFWTRVVMSLVILSFAFAVTLTSIFKRNTTMWKGFPVVLSVILFFFLMCFVGMMEGMQIAVFAVVNLPDEEIRENPVAHRNCKMALQNLQAFLIGRQVCVTICMFVVARITTLNITVGKDANVFGVANSLQAFFNLGLLGALITTIGASLVWRVVASSFPIAFLANPLVGPIIRLSLFLEASGICSASWALARLLKFLVKYKPDEDHLKKNALSIEPVQPDDTFSVE